MEQSHLKPRNTNLQFATLAPVLRSTALLWSMWLGLLAATVAWRGQNLEAFGVSNDEGAYLMWARLVTAGYPLYREAAANQPPLFIETLALTFQWLGFSVATGRAMVLLWFVGLALVLAYLSHRIAGWPGRWLLLLWLGVLSPFFLLSRQVLLELPAMLPAVAAVAALVHGLSHPAQRLRWLWLSGVLLGVSLLVKFLYIVAFAPLLWLLWHSHRSWKPWFRESLILGLAAGLSFWLPLLLFFDTRAFIDQTILFRSSTWSADLIPRPGNFELLLNFVGQSWGLGLLALAGLIAGYRRERVQAWTLWLILTAVLLLNYNPVFPHHFSLLLPPALLLMLEFVAISQTWRTRHATKSQAVWRGIFYRYGGPALFVLAALNLPTHIQANQTQLAATTGGREADAARVLAEVTRPGDFAISDSQMLLHFANRLNPPPSIDFSLNTIQSGRHTPQQLIDMSNAYDVAAVAPWSLRLIWLPEYLDWAADHYWVERVWDNQHRLYFGRKHPPNTPVPNASQHRFLTNGQVGPVLIGYQLEQTHPQADRFQNLTLYWQTEQQLNTDYTVFVQLLQADGRLASQIDRQPLAGYFPTTQWPIDEVISDRLTLPLPSPADHGPYTLIAGLYDGSSGERLSLAAGGDHVVLTQISLEAERD